MMYYIAMKLKELRKQLGLTQPEAAFILNIPFRTYCRYEAETRYENTFKYTQMVSVLEKKAEQNILKVATIQNILNEIFPKYAVKTCYLFGSYAKGSPKGESDVDLLIVSDVEGIEYYQLLGELETKLRKKVDLLRLNAAIQNPKLMGEILITGVKIYEQH